MSHTPQTIRDIVDDLLSVQFPTNGWQEEQFNQHGWIEEVETQLSDSIDIRTDKGQTFRLTISEVIE